MTSIAYGTYNIDKTDLHKYVLDAIKIGYRKFDTAQLYKNQTELGIAIKDAIKQSDLKREDFFIQSKIHNKFQKAGTTKDAIDMIIKEIGFDYIDCIILHSPIKGKYIDAYGELIKSQKEGKVKHIGVSNFRKNELKKLMETYPDNIPYINQIELSILYQRNELFQFCKKHKIEIEAHSIFSRGKYFEISEEDNKEKASLINCAIEFQLTVPELMIAWIINKNIPFVITTTNKMHLFQNFNLAHLNKIQEFKHVDLFENIVYPKFKDK